MIKTRRQTFCVSMKNISNYLKYKSKVDLIVIGSHGKSALKTAVLGSITFGIINKETNLPVLIVRR